MGLDLLVAAVEVPNCDRDQVVLLALPPQMGCSASVEETVDPTIFALAAVNVVAVTAESPIAPASIVLHYWCAAEGIPPRLPPQRCHVVVVRQSPRSSVSRKML